MAAQLIGARYQLETCIGEGGMGTVFRGVDIQTQETVAIKRLKPELASAEMLERFAREGAALRQLNHPNIVKVLAALEHDDEHYLVMEYCDGGSLYDGLKATPQLPVKRTLEIALELADALSRAHHLKIIHRDLKPANVLLAHDGTPRLTDFGIAHISSEKPMTETGVAIGTLDYLCPEALNGDPVDARADLWAFGVMLFEMLTGRRPFYSENVTGILTNILVQPTPDLEALRPDAPVALVDLIYRMLEKSRDQRISSARLVAAALEAVIQQRDTPLQPIQRINLPTPTPTDPTQLKHNLPAQTTPFVGREHELEALTKLLHDPKTHLITIAASGGMGKTRLALEAAEQHLAGARHALPPQEFSDGVFFVDLAPLSEASGIPQAIAEAVAYQFVQDGREPKHQIVDFLREKHLLLLMDNYEHLLAGVSLVSDMLHAAPHVKVLVTSRERLNLNGETVFTLSGMDFPEWETPQDALEYSAVKLFMQSARRLRPDFQLEVDDLRYVARICRMVDGTPLGIVLAAAWVEMLSLPEIAREISQNLDFLEGETRDVPERHRSLRAVFDYSWNLLRDEERALFAKLSVFQGDFTREAAQAAADASLRGLMNLMNKSLIRRDAESGRYELHPLLRQYAAEHLNKSSEEAHAAHDRHCSSYMAFLAQYERMFAREGKQKEALRGIKLEFTNARAAWRWAVEHGHFEEIAQSYDGFSSYFILQALDHEGAELFRWSANMLRTSTLPPESARLKAYAICLLEEGWCLSSWGHKARIAALLEESLAILRALPPSKALVSALGLKLDLVQDLAERKQLVQEALNIAAVGEVGWWRLNMMLNMAALHSELQELDDAEAIAQAVLGLSGESGDALFQVNALLELKGIAAARRDHALAQQYAEQATAIAEANELDLYVCWALSSVAEAAYVQGDYVYSERCYQRMLALGQQLKQGWVLLIAHAGLIGVASRQGDKHTAYQHIRDGLSLAQNLPPHAIFELSIGIAEYLAVHGDLERAVQVHAAAAVHPNVHPAKRILAATLRDALRAMLTPEVYARGVEASKTLELDQVVKALAAV
jgi:serine/threonine protein kinase